MVALKYTVIKTEKQYNEYCQRMEELGDRYPNDPKVEDEMDLIYVLIEKWDNEQRTFSWDEYDPVQLLKSIMKDNKIRAVDLAAYLQISKGYMSDILNYKKGFSKEVIRKLADRFKMRQEAFNKKYKLKK
jgi:HTH-type transcriptional regulator/antitoxin HigA